MFWLAVGLMFSDDWCVAFQSHHIRDLEKGSLGKWGLQKEDILLCVWEDSAAALICSIPTSFHPSDFLGKGSLIGLFQRNVEPWRFAVEAMVPTQCAAAAQQRAAEKSSRREEQPPRSYRTRSTSSCNTGESDDSPVRWKSYSHRSGAQCRFLIANTSSFQTLDWRRGCLWNTQPRALYPNIWVVNSVSLKCARLPGKHSVSLGIQVPRCFFLSVLCPRMHCLCISSSLRETWCSFFLLPLAPRDFN